jgi:hypothetical protein
MVAKMTAEQIADLCLKRVHGDERRAYALAEGLVARALQELKMQEALGFSAALGWMEAKGWNLQDSRPVEARPVV